MPPPYNSQRPGRRSPPVVWPAGYPPPQLKLRLENCPPRTTTIELDRHFSKFGNVDYIRIEDFEAGRAYLTFSPPPSNLPAFFRESHILFEPSTGLPFALKLFTLDFQHKAISSPLDPQRKFPSQLIIHSSHMRVGVVTSEEQELMALRVTNSDVSHPILIKAQLKDAPEISIQFTGYRHGMWQNLELRCQFSNIARVHKSVSLHNSRIMTITFQHPPKFFALPPGHARPDSSQPEEATVWFKNRSYRRITDIDTDQSRRDKSVTTLFRPGYEAFIDPGRWLTWSFTFKVTPFNGFALPLLVEMFSAYNVNITTGELRNRAPDRGSVIWHAFDLDNHVNSKSAFQSSALQTLQAQSEGFPILSFEVRYALEVCFSKGLLFEGSVSGPFLARLAEPRAVDLLENLVLSDKPLYNPMQLFTSPELRTLRKRRVPKTCVLMHSVTITPTTMYVQPIQVEVSNRVIRRYIEHADRFLRVRFSDEAYFGKLQSQRDDRDVEIYDRVRRTLVNGIRVAGRHYVFLACGNSQFRENGAYFFSNNESVTVTGIRQWMGFFQHIREIPKYVSRIGQCFSTTRAVTSIGVTPEIVEIPDIQRNGFTFTDGVGKLSKFLAHMISQELRLGPDAPSLFQFRMGGCKGVLAVDPTLSGRAVHIRPSQRKFKTDYNQLEIIRWSSFASAYLNRQIILVLSSLGIPDSVFVRKIQVQLAEINKALEDNNIAISMLQANVDFNQVTLAMAKMIQAGMRRDPFVDSMLHLWRAWMKKSLKEKANMFIPDGAFILGCVDETATLRMDDGQLPEIFLQVPDLQNGGNYRVIEGTCILVRNPALHPGDIRVVKAVDCNKLRHLKDVVVVPQLGKRDLANMCAGGDLDGDDFLIMWDPELIPTEQNHEPMDYSAPAPILSKGPVTQSDIIQFFCDYMKNDSLGNIAVAHRAWADKEATGVKHSKCVKLAQLHSQAVDYPKTGVPARMTPELKPERYPHWLEKPRHMSYNSPRVLGKLYDEVDRVDFKPSYEQTFDSRILNAFELPQELLEQAYALKTEYDIDMRRIMAQFGINTEFEVWSAFVMSHNREVKLYKFAEEVGRLVSMLKHHYRDLCFQAIEMKPHDRDLQKLGPLVAALYQVTADDVAAFKEDLARVDAALRTEPADAESSGEELQPPMMSFPWIFQDELLGIATMASTQTSLSEAMVHNTLAAKNWQATATGGDRASSIQHHYADIPNASSLERTSQMQAQSSPAIGKPQSSTPAKPSPVTSPTAPAPKSPPPKSPAPVMTIDQLSQRFGAATIKENVKPSGFPPQHHSYSSPHLSTTDKPLKVQTPADAASSTGSGLSSPVKHDPHTSRSQSPSSSVSSEDWSNGKPADSTTNPGSLQNVKVYGGSTDTIKGFNNGNNSEQDMIDLDDEEEEVFEIKPKDAHGQNRGVDAFKQLSSLVRK
ncbi:RNA-dependent RNA polymerase-like protein [Elsinoe australis]|uniref:RNA-dependent RNA polymerase n=1 Tax=Elsinoe australis TaxID=40998 RepID=A0A4V6DW44_9PEZI|nr:RNA-dependent RNA polymerase-like protein [Elsinoe australis]